MNNANECIKGDYCPLPPCHCPHCNGSGCWVATEELLSDYFDLTSHESQIIDPPSVPPGKCDKCDARARPISDAPNSKWILMTYKDSDEPYPEGYYWEPLGPLYTDDHGHYVM